MTAILRLALASVLLSACSVPVAVDEPEAVEENSEAVSACGRVKYDAALAHYKNAVAWSKDRLAKGVCNSDNGYQWSIADEASRAVMTCGEFRSILRNSPWAAPVRTVLGPSLTLRSLTGELLVIRDSSFQNWTGTEALFARGLTFWARGEGAYGPSIRIEFRANGKATWNELYEAPGTFDISMRATAATYTISKTTESGKRTIKVTHAGKTDVYTLRVENPLVSTDAPVFTLDPSTSTKKLYSLVGECDA
jgi:hypothetical protein